MARALGLKPKDCKFEAPHPKVFNRQLFINLAVVFYCKCCVATKIMLLDSAVLHIIEAEF